MALALKNPFHDRRRNPWLEKDRKDQLKVMLTAVLFVLAVVTGIGLLIYALIQS